MWNVNILFGNSYSGVRVMVHFFEDANFEKQDLVKV